MSDWKNSAKGGLAGALTGTAFGLGGFWLARIPETQAMGSVMFFLVPLCAGFAITIVTRAPNRMSAAAILATLGSLGTLILTRTETFLCVVLAFPVLFAGFVIGIGIGIASGMIFRELTSKPRDITYRSVVLLLVPLLILAGHRVEVSTLVHPRQEIVTSTIRLAAEPSDIWAGLRSFDSLTANKPFLMYVGLPVPIRCVMQGSGAGAKRACYFDQGYIEETVTEWTPPMRWNSPLIAPICQGAIGSISRTPGTSRYAKVTGQSWPGPLRSLPIFIPSGIGDRLSDGV